MRKKLLKEYDTRTITVITSKAVTSETAKFIGVEEWMDLLEQ